MLNAIQTTELPGNSLSVEIRTFKGVNGFRIPSNSATAAQWGDNAQQRIGIIKTADPLLLDLGTNVKLLALGVSSQVTATLTKADATTQTLKINKLLVLDDADLVSLALAFTPTEEETECRFWLDWLTTPA